MAKIQIDEWFSIENNPNFQPIIFDTPIPSCGHQIKPKANVFNSYINLEKLKSNNKYDVIGAGSYIESCNYGMVNDSNGNVYLKAQFTGLQSILYFNSPYNSIPEGTYPTFAIQNDEVVMTGFMYWKKQMKNQIIS